MKLGTLKNTGFKKLGMGLALAGALFLAGCQAELYSDLKEREVNEMISVLASNGINASRTTDGKGAYGISVPSGDFSIAIAKLSEKGLPRPAHKSLGNVFNNDKLVSTPFEERARFMYALNEELSQSISLINGVVSARVHMMIPEASPFEKNKTPPRASVFIYQEKGLDLRAEIPRIKNLIVNSLDNLEYSYVEVALFDDNTVTTSSGIGGAKTTIAGFSFGGMWNVILLVLLGVVAWFGFKASSSGNSTKRNKISN